MWYVLQLTVFVAVVFSNIHWQWTPNKLLAALIGAGLAFAVTWLLSGLIALLRRCFRREQVGDAPLINHPITRRRPSPADQFGGNTGLVLGQRRRAEPPQLTRAHQ